LRTLRSSPDFEDLDIIVVTALGEEEIEDRGGLPDGVKVFRKPVPFAELEDCVRKHFALTQKQQ
ncbi:MAG: excisionase, partial [Acidobacteria bacterium]|nr:excisionase [Acidobacteriota bacterium]NIM64114.1 excisionase [Acidobacteriota bacterium]NIQ85001.1 excisionase [Acidobacteriota bacterium]NIT11881.1 excisionase [Acidobacteriota bacterium]